MVETSQLRSHAVAAQGLQLLEAILDIAMSEGTEADSAEATAAAVAVMSITAMGMATAGLRLPCTLPTGRVGTTILHTGRAGTTLHTGTTPPTGTPETTMKAAGVAVVTPRPLMAVAGLEGTDRSHRIGCRKEDMVVAAELLAVAMTGKKRGPFCSRVPLCDAGWQAAAVSSFLTVVALPCCIRLL